ncbi:MAG: hypothetical protein R3348_08440 [Xanthomonadales bacterium]|nr:hypothetical protein [Xanthomonadales bacterium]
MPGARRRLSIRQQIHRNAVALISLIVAIGSLGYNTWRNETTEAQRNVRHAAFRVLESLGELQEAADYHYYFVREEGAGSEEQWLQGWGQAALIRDLTRVMPPPAPQAGFELYAAWDENFSLLDNRDADGRRTGKAREGKQVIMNSIENTRQAVLDVLRGLD